MQPATASQSRGVGGRTVERFEYPACPGTPSEPAWDGWAEADEDLVQVEESPDRTAVPATGVEFEERLAEETRRAFETGRAEGRRAEREAMAPSAAAETERRRRQISELVEGFARERDRYLQAVEQEVVRLALAVAARILRREAQMDPLLLTGAVRVALGQLAATSEVRIRVPANEADLWTETIAHLPNLAIKPQVVAEEGMLLGDCVVESKAGSVDLGVRSQLGEIERGFFDRAATPHATVARPGAGANGETSPPEASPAEARA